MYFKYSLSEERNLNKGLLLIIHHLIYLHRIIYDLFSIKKQRHISKSVIYI